MSTVRAHLFSSTASCIKCVTIGLDRYTLNKVRLSGPMFSIVLHIHFCAGKPSGYDRVRNAEIGNKVGLN